MNQHNSDLEDTEYSPDSEQALVDYPANTGKRLKFAAMIVAAALAIAFVVVELIAWHRESAMAMESEAAAHAPQRVDVVKVVPAPASSSLILPGETRAWYETTIYARVNGYIVNWSADIGDKVTKGQVLATIDTPDLDDQLAATQAKIKASEAKVKALEAAAVFAKSTFQRWWDSPKGVVSEQERQEKKSQYDSTAAQVNAAQAEVNLDQADVDRLTTLAKFKEVTAPFDGTITARRVDIGDLVTAGSTTNTSSLFGLAQSDQIRVFVDAPESASVALVSGAQVTITADEFPGRIFTGTVARTSQAIDPVSRTLRVEVDIPNPSLTLLPGMYVQVKFDIPQTALSEVRAAAILMRPSGPQVAVVRDGKVHFQRVSIVHDNGDYVDLGPGLAADDVVVLNISDAIAEGDVVVPTVMEQK